MEVVRTARGVVFADGLSLQDPATERGDVGFESLLPLLRARTVDDVDRALDHWVEPVNNVVVADTGGAVRYRLAGLVPTRDADGAWTGWLDADTTGRHDVPDDGQVVTANERRGPESDLVGAEFAAPHRARRIHALLDGRTGLTAADMAAIHGDALLATVPVLASLVPGAFDDFDGRMAAGSPAAGRFAAWRSALVRRVVAQPVFAAIREPAPEHRHSTVFAPWLNLTYTVGAEPADPGRAPGRRSGSTWPAWRARRWTRSTPPGRRSPGATPTWPHPLHAFATLGRTPPDLPAPPVSGDSSCVCATASYPALSDACSRGPVARYVWDLADRQASGWVVPTGADGRPGTPHHHDQLASLGRGRAAARRHRLGPAHPGPAGARELLLEPGLRVRVVVVALDPAVPGALVHRDRLGEHAVRVEPDDVVAALAGEVLEVPQQPAGEPGAAPVGVHPHPLHLVDAGRDALQPAAGGGGAGGVGHHEPVERLRVAGIEAGGEPGVDLGVVGRHRRPRDRPAGVDVGEPECRRPLPPVAGHGANATTVWAVGQGLPGGVTAVMQD